MRFVLLKVGALKKVGALDDWMERMALEKNIAWGIRIQLRTATHVKAKSLGFGLVRLLGSVLV